MQTKRNTAELVGLVTDNAHTKQLRIPLLCHFRDILIVKAPQPKGIPGPEDNYRIFVENSENLDLS